MKSITLPDVPAELTQWSNADIEFPSTSTSDEIEIISQPDEELLFAPLAKLTVEEKIKQQIVQDENDEDVFINEVSVEPENNPKLENLQAENNVESAKIENETIEQTIETFVPTAPVIDEIEKTSSAQTSPNKLLYPNLKSLVTGSLTQSKNAKERIILQPFTSVQLKELYHNPELVLAESFEHDFIDNELNSSYKEHPLFDLIKKYSQSRYNLKVNMLDLQDYIKSFQQHSQNVWIIENRINTYEGICNDGERIRKNELYE